MKRETNSSRASTAKAMHALKETVQTVAKGVCGDGVPFIRDNGGKERTDREIACIKGKEGTGCKNAERFNH